MQILGHKFRLMIDRDGTRNRTFKGIVVQLSSYIFYIEIFYEEKGRKFVSCNSKNFY